MIYLNSSHVSFLSRTLVDTWSTSAFIGQLIVEPHRKNYRIYSASARVFYDPQLQIVCCYVARYYVKK